MSNSPLNTKQSCWLKMRQAMSVLNVSRDTMRSYCEEGLVRAKKLPGGHWRIDQDSLEQFMQNHSRLVVERLRGLML